MKVKDLIESLSRCDPELEVAYDIGNALYNEPNLVVGILSGRTSRLKINFVATAHTGTEEPFRIVVLFSNKLGE